MPQLHLQHLPTNNGDRKVGFVAEELFTHS